MPRTRVKREKIPFVACNFPPAVLYWVENDATVWQEGTVYVSSL